jgi:mannose-1-phosphate guanylyltransferase
MDYLRKWCVERTLQDWGVLQGLLAGDVSSMKMPGKQIKEGVWAGLNTRIDWDGTMIEGPVYIGAGCHIEAGSKNAGPCWNGHGSHICEGAEVIRSILFEYTRVLPNTMLDELIVCGDYSADLDGNMLQLSEARNCGLLNARDRRKMPRNIAA